MARYLSTEWFDEVARTSLPAGVSASPEDLPGQLVLEQVVTGTPEGEVRYQVIVEQGASRIVTPQQTAAAGESGRGQPDLTITTDWDTAVAIARGQLAAQSALMQGRLRVRGNLARLATRSSDLAGLDSVPPAVRRSTTY